MYRVIMPDTHIVPSCASPALLRASSLLSVDPAAIWSADGCHTVRWLFLEQA
jgi:hypothetical protein